MVAADIAALEGRVIVGLTGPPGAGKSTLAAHLVDHLGAAYLPMDGFHLSNAQLDRQGRRTRKGAPDTFDADGYVAVLQRIVESASRREVYVPGFDRTLDEPVAATYVVPTGADVVVTEGNYLALPESPWFRVRTLVHRLYFVDCPTAVRRKRLAARHLDGGRSPREAHAWVDEVDERNAALILATRDRCDRVLDLSESRP